MSIPSMNRQYEEILMHTSCLPLNIKGLIPNTISNEARSSNPMINQITPNRGAQRIWNKCHQNTGNVDQVADKAEKEGAQGVENPMSTMTIFISDHQHSHPSLLHTFNVRYEKDFPPLPACPMIALQRHTAIDNSHFFFSVSYCTVPINQPIVEGNASWYSLKYKGP